MNHMDIKKINNSRNRRPAHASIAVLKKVTAMAIIMALVLGNPWFGKFTTANAALVVIPDYTDQTLSITSNGGSTKFYMSSDNKKNWELIDAGDLDITPYLTTKEVTLYFKGNKDAETQVKLPAEDKTFKPTYTITSGIGKIIYTSTSAVQFRNGPNGIWQSVTGGAIYTSMYEVKGTMLFFRTAPQISTRAGKIISVRVPKRPTAPSAKLDYNKLCITGVKANETKYRMGDNLAWTPVPVINGANYVDVSSLLGGSTSGNLAIPAGTIEFMTSGTDKKLNSAVRVIEVPSQPTIIASNVTLTGNVLKITDTTKIYEYTKVAITDNLDFYKARWTAIPSSGIATIKNTLPNDKIYVRVKSATDKVTKQVSLPSTYVLLTVK
jgi:hypothetical protein